jgi:hypothetical protein
VPCPIPRSSSRTTRQSSKYYALLKTFHEEHVEHEGAPETAFSRLRVDTARPLGWTLIPKQTHKVGSKSISPNGTLRDKYNLYRG